jgi:hypothetical protein
MLEAVITLVIDREHAQAANARHGAKTPPGGLCIRCGWALAERSDAQPLSSAAVEDKAEDGLPKMPRERRG